MDFRKQENPSTTSSSSSNKARFMNLMVMRSSDKIREIPKYEENDDDNTTSTTYDNNTSANEEKKRKSFTGGTTSSSTRRTTSCAGGGGSGGTSCQADNCTADLTEAKRYHRRHKVCEFHAKAASVLVSGLRQRFCQQCSRFHELSEFDETKRSCRRRLAGHNERRRKSSSEPQGEGGSTASRQKGGGPQSSSDIERGSSRVQRPYPGNPATYKHFRSDKFGVVSD